ncbi:MAG: CAAD domain-containing protein, partial [Rhizonema sp. PD37]|nr:CAAD domain-containing protein [Rhizonema sp. PD37]
EIADIKPEQSMVLETDSKENINGAVNEIADIKPEQSMVLETDSKENINSVVNEIADIKPEQSMILETDSKENINSVVNEIADIKTEQSMVLETSNEENINSVVNEIADKTSYTDTKLPATNLFDEYKSLIISIPLIIASIITVKIILAIVEAINDIPQINSVINLAGIGYAGWFVFRYLLKASSRQELGEQLNSIQKEIVKGED